MESYFSKEILRGGEGKLAPRKKSYEEVFAAFKERGYTLITGKYKNNKQRLKYICPKHPEEPQTTRFNDLMSGHGCKKCGRERTIQNMKKQAESQRLKYEDVREEIESEGFKLLSSEYKNARQLLKIECPKKHIFRSRIGDFRRGIIKCKKCAIDSRRIPFHEVVENFDDKGYILLENSYKNTAIPMKYICSKHPYEIKEISLDSVRGGHECFECAIEKISGENSVHYKHDKTEEDREKDRRLDPEERHWRIKVFQRDNFTCQYCKKYSRDNINAHHKDGYNWCLDRRYDITNGVTLCIECHKKFHTIYGYGDNTEEQYNEWIEHRN